MEWSRAVAPQRVKELTPKRLAFSAGMSNCDILLAALTLVARRPKLAKGQCAWIGRLRAAFCLYWKARNCTHGAAVHERPLFIQEVIMAGSSRPTAAKRAKERARQEKRQEKMQRRAQRKLEQEQNPAERPAELVVTYNEEGQPEGFNFHDF